MLMESKVKFPCPLNISGASQKDSIAAFPKTTELNGDLFWYVKKNNWK